MYDISCRQDNYTILWWMLIDSSSSSLTNCIKFHSTQLYRFLSPSIFFYNKNNGLCACSGIGIIIAITNSILAWVNVLIKTYLLSIQGEVISERIQYYFSSAAVGALLFSVTESYSKSSYCDLGPSAVYTNDCNRCHDATLWGQRPGDASCKQTLICNNNDGDGYGALWDVFGSP